MRFGFHVSIAGGLSQVIPRAKKLDCETIQLFTRSPRGWRAGPLDEEEVVRFRRDLAESDVAPVFVHAPYLANLATEDTGLGRQTVELLAAEADRCRQLGINYLIVHVGKATGKVERPESGARKPGVRRQPTDITGSVLEHALNLVAERTNVVLERSPETVTVLLENTAGMGSEVGFTFEQIAAVIGRTGSNDRLGVVLDTAHLFEAGYEMRTRQGLDETLRGFDRTVGLSRLHLLHLNDSKTTFESRVDRHWHIGKGEIGLDGFREIVSHPLLAHLPGIMETPRKSETDDQENMKTIRGLAARPAMKGLKK